jgi:Reverse transcriptase (RNA-dependent DNA polymerase)
MADSQDRSYLAVAIHGNMASQQSTAGGAPMATVSKPAAAQVQQVAGAPQQSQVSARQQPTHAPSRLTNRNLHPRKSPSTMHGYSVLIFNIPHQLTMTNAGAPARCLLNLACRKYAHHSISLTDAFTCLAIAKMKWMGDSRHAHIHRPTCIPLSTSNIPSRYVTALLDNRSVVKRALQVEYQWRLVFLEDGKPMSMPATTTASDNRFAALGEDCPASVASTYTGRFVRRKYKGLSCYGVIQYLSEECAPYIFRIHYVDNPHVEHELMSFAEIKKYVLGPANRIPGAMHAALVVVAASVASTPNNNASTSTMPNSSLPSNNTNSSSQARRDLAWSLQGMRVAVLNARGLTQHKAANIEHAMDTIHADIIGITETWEGRCSMPEVAGYKFVGCARKDGQGGGVGAYISKSRLPMITVHRATHLPESIWLKIRSNKSTSSHVFVGIVYLPPSQLQTSNTTAQIFQQLQEDVNVYRTKGEVILMGDFNCRVGSADRPDDHVGMWGEKIQIDHKGQALRAFLTNNNMYALNNRIKPANPLHPAYTREQLLQDRDSNMTTSQRSIIDYIIVPQHYALPVYTQEPLCKLHVEPRHLIDSTDHMMLWTTIPNIPKASHSTDEPPVYRARVHYLTKPSDARNDHRQAYQDAIYSSLNNYADIIAEAYTQVDTTDAIRLQAVAGAKHALVESIHAAVQDSIGYQKSRSSKRGHRRFINTPAVHAAVQHKKAALQQLNQLHDSITSDTSTMEQQAHLQAAMTEAKLAEIQVKKAVKQGRAQVRQQMVSDLRKAVEEHDSKGVWQHIHALGRSTPRSDGPAALKTTDGAICVDDQEIANTLQKHYETVTHPATFAQNADFCLDHTQNVESDVQVMAQYTSYLDQGTHDLSSAISQIEVELALKHVQNHKAPSPIDGIHNELLKYGGPCMIAALTDLFNLQWDLETKAPTTGVIRSLHKRGDTTLANNYRPITLGATIDKLYNVVINTRLMRFLEDNDSLHDAQQAFRPKRCTLDNILMLTTAMQARKKQQLDTYLLFLDIEKAYDSVWRAGLMWHVWQSGVRGKMFRVLHQMSNASSSVVMHRGKYSQVFSAGMGWEQGDTLATTMFNIHINSILTTVWEKHSGVPVPALDSQACNKLAALMFADDFVGLASSPSDMQAMIETVRSELKTWRLKASVSSTDASKTAVMAMGPGSTGHAWTWGEVQLPVVKEYKYLGVMLTNDGKFTEHIDNRLEKATKASHALHGAICNPALPWTARTTALSACIQPTACYAYSCCGKNTKQMRDQLDSFQMDIVKRMVRCPATANHSRLQQELGIIPMHVACDAQSLTFWHRVANLPDCRLVKQILNSWDIKHNTWKQRVQQLLAQYDIAPETTALSKTAFKNLLDQQIATYVQQLWSKRTNNAANQNEATAGSMQPYFRDLTYTGRGYAAQLIMQLRLECLPLNAATWRSKRQRAETAVQATNRQQCPCCRSCAETTTHFLMECTNHASDRQIMWQHMQQIAPQKFDELQAMDTPQRAQQIMSPQFWAEGLAEGTNVGRDVFGCIASYVTASWKRRQPALCAETDGLTPMV